MVDYAKFSNVDDSDEEPVWAQPNKSKNMTSSTEDELEKGVQKMKNGKSYVYLDFATNVDKLKRYAEEFESEGLPVPKAKLGRVIIELDQAAHAPRLCENFRLLCTGERGVGANGNRLCYQDRPLDYIMPRYCVQGSIPNELSCWGRYLEDEKLRIPGSRFDSAGIVAVGNHGPHTNSTTFMITLHEAEHINGYNQIIGRVVHGLDVLRVVESLPTDRKDKSYTEKNVKTYFGGRPIIDVMIESCGQLRQEQVDAAIAADGDSFLAAVAHVTSPEQYDSLHESAQSIKELGNGFFRSRHFAKAADKYQKASEYLEPLMDKEAVDGFYDVDPSWTPKSVDSLMHESFALKLNVLQVRLAQEDWKVAVGAGNKIYEDMMASLPRRDPLVGKLLFKRARARLALVDSQSMKGQLEKAIEDLQQALSVEPESTEIAAELEKAQLRKMIPATTNRMGDDFE